MDVPLGRWVGRDNAAFRHFDPTLLVTAILLAIYGLLMVKSASGNLALELTGNENFFRNKQIVSLMLGLIILVVTATFDYRLAKVYAPIAYGVVLFLLLLVLTPIGA
jgi:rod shape determining protein RodA